MYTSMFDIFFICPASGEFIRIRNACDTMCLVCSSSVLLYALGSSKAFSPHPCHWTRMLELHGPRLGDCPPGFQCDKQVISKHFTSLHTYSPISSELQVWESWWTIYHRWENQGLMTTIWAPQYRLGEKFIKLNKEGHSFYLWKSQFQFVEVQILLK